MQTVRNPHLEILDPLAVKGIESHLRKFSLEQQAPSAFWINHQERADSRFSTLAAELPLVVLGHSSV
jgi:hypothetical protein